MLGIENSGEFANRVEEILHNTLHTLEDGKSQMYTVAESAHQECNRLSAGLDVLSADVEQSISTVEQLEKAFKACKFRLYETSLKIDDFSDQQRTEAYKDAEQIRESLAVARERERNLRMQRDEVERSLASMKTIASRADRLVSQVGVALNYLAGNIQDVSEQIENVHARYQIGQGILKGQEAERKRMAREMHDGPAQDMANVVVRMDICRKLYKAGKTEEAFEEYQAIRDIIQYSIRDIRRLIHDLSPMTLDDLGLVHTVRRFVNEISEHYSLQAEVKVSGDETRLEPTVELALFRTIQEAVNNSCKHGQPSQILVRIEFLPTKIAVAVFDNGIGFEVPQDKNKLSFEGHYGLFGMRDRIDMLGGTFQLHSRPGQGTRIIVMLPLRLRTTSTREVSSEEN